MCWKRYEPDPPPSPTPMAFFGASTEAYGAVNATEGGITCPDVATRCSNITNSHIRDCNHGICCEHISGDQFCSCFSGWEEPDCDYEGLVIANKGSVHRPPDVLSTIPISPIFLHMDKAEGSTQASSNSVVLIAVLTVLILLGLSIVIFLVYRRRRSCRNSEQQGLASRDVTVTPNSAHLLQPGDTNGNNKDART